MFPDADAGAAAPQSTSFAADLDQIRNGNAFAADLDQVRQTSSFAADLDLVRQPDFLPGHRTTVSSGPPTLAAAGDMLSPTEVDVVGRAAPTQARMGTSAIAAPPPAAAAASRAFTPSEIEDASRPDVPVAGAPSGRTTPAAAHPEARLGAAPARAPVPVAPRRLGSAKTGGAATAIPGVLDTPTEGVKQFVRGAGALVARPAVLPTEPHVVPPAAAGKDEETYNALADMLEGAAKVATPLAVAGAIVDLPGTALTLGASYLASAAAGGAATFAQASPAVQRFVTALAGSATALGLGAGQIGRLKAKAADFISKQAADARAVTAQTAAHDAAYDAANPPLPTEPIAVGRGATPAARGARVLPPAREALPPAPEPPSPLPPDQPAPVAPQAPAGTPEVPLEHLVAELASADPREVDGYHAMQTTLAELARRGIDADQARALVEAAKPKPPATPSVLEAARTPKTADPRDIVAVEQPARVLSRPEPTAPFAPEALQASETKTPASTTHEFASTQIDLPADVSEGLQALQQKIPDEDLAPDGREIEPHVTVKFGLHDNDPAPVAALLDDEPPVTVRLGKTSIFPNGESNAGDVVKVDVDSPDLHRLNQKIADALPNTDTHPDYSPHATVAYVKPGLGEKYAGDATLEGRTATVDRIVFSGKNGERVEIPLRGAAEASPSGALVHAAPAIGERGRVPVASRVTPSVPPPIGDLVARREAEVRAGTLGAPVPVRAKSRPTTSASIDTPAEAASDVVAQIDRVVDTKGARSGADVHRRVLDTLTAELEPAIAAAGFSDVTFEKQGSTGAGRVRVDGKAVAEMDRYGSLTWFYPDDERLKAVPLSKVEHRDSSPSAMARQAAFTVAAALGKANGARRLQVQIPGDGTFTIEQNPLAIRATIDRIRSLGAGTWRDVLKPHIPPRPAPAPVAAAPSVVARPKKAAVPVRGRSQGAHASIALPSSTPAATSRAAAEATASGAAGTPPAAAGGTVLDAAFVPGGRQFYERDVVPAIKRLFEELQASSRGVREVLAPDTIGQSAAAAAGVVRATKALEANQLGQAQRVLKATMKAWDQVPREEQLAFAMAIDEGHVDDLPSWQREAARLFAEINALYRTEVRRRGGFRHGYIEGYFPRQWDQPGQVTQWLRGSLTARRPFKGRQGFRKQRARKENGLAFTFREMYDRGFRPVNYNPVEAWLDKWVEMRKWISAYDIVREHKRVGVAKFIRIGGAAPEGWRRYPDSYGTVYGKPTVTVKEAFDPKLRAGLEQLIADLGVTHRRQVNVGGSTRWGWARGDRMMATKFGGPEGVIMHELGHILDARFGLGAMIGANLGDEARSQKDFGEKSWAKRELAALADLRIEGVPAAHVSPGYKSYIRNQHEKIANLVHGFLYARERVKAIAPNSFWALYNLAKDTPELRPLLTLQQTRGLGLGVDEREVRITGALITGYYYGPDEAVRLMEHYLSPGLQGSRGYRQFRAVGNIINQVQLGLSAFHLTMTSLNAVMSKSAVGLERVSRGHILEGLTKIATSPAAPFVDLWRGHQALQALRTSSPSTQAFADIASQIIQGGGREGWDPFWHQHTAVKKWVQAWRGVAAEAKAGNYPGAAARAGVGLARTLPMLLEAQAKPIMQFFVPRLKMAAFLDLARLELDDLGEVPDLVEGRKALGKAWDTVDNRFGELIYDNLFWDNRLKDAALAMVRAPGWNIGTMREVFGAVPAQLRQVGVLPAAGGGGIGKPPSRVRHAGYDAGPNGPTPRYEVGDEPRLTHKFAYFLSMLFWTAVLGAVTQYLHTGLKPGEQDDGTIDPSQIPLDLYFPRREKNQDTWKRVVLPTYMRDLYAVAHNFPYGAGTAAIHKIHPLWTLAIEFLKNEDYWGTEVRNAEDPLRDQAAQVFDWLAKEVQPIGVKSVRESGHPAESLVGLTPAPAYVTRSALENYLRDVAPPTHRTLDQAKQGEVRREIRKDLAAGDPTAAAAAARSGVLSKRQVQAAVRSTRLSSLQRGYQHLSIEQAIHGYELATPEERRALQPLLQRKAATAGANIAPEDRERVTARLYKALGLPVEAGKAFVPVAPAAARPQAPGAR